MKTTSFLKSGSLALAATGLLTACQEGRDERPNIIVILADDLGYSDLGCYGGEIHTPNLDRLAEEGMRFSRFYNCSRSCPTRASLLTGLYQHQAGIGRMTFDAHLPGYRGQLSDNAVTIAEVLRGSGYRTGMVGKWHVAETPLQPDQRDWLNHQVHHPAFADKACYPTHRGFDDYYGIIYGVADYFDPFSLVSGEEPVRDVPDDYYITTAFSDSAVAYVNRYAQGDRPFFLYLSYTAPHWPLHALPEDIALYEDTYRVGWDSIRAQRYGRMEQLGILADAGHALKANGQYDNTLILFLSDNGCSPEVCQNFAPGENDRPDRTRDGREIIYPKNKEALPGPETTFASLGAEWANVANTPFRYWKAREYEGGICTPLIAHWPQGIEQPAGSITAEPGHVMDIMATCIDLAGATYPAEHNGHAITPLEGKSLAPVFRTGTRDGHEYIGFEHFGEKALIGRDGWKIVQPAGENKKWELYNLNEDRTELHDLAAAHPDKVAEMERQYNAWAERCLVVPAPR